jgi:hypothetical protein
MNQTANDREQFNHGRPRIAVAIRNDIVSGLVG